MKEGGVVLMHSGAADATLGQVVVGTLAGVAKMPVKNINKHLLAPSVLVYLSLSLSLSLSLEKSMRM